MSQVECHQNVLCIKSKEETFKKKIASVYRFLAMSLIEKKLCKNICIDSAADISTRLTFGNARVEIPWHQIAPTLEEEERNYVARM